MTFFLNFFQKIVNAFTFFCIFAPENEKKLLIKSFKMKKTKFTLLAIILCISVLAFAQEKKSEWIPKVSGFAQLRYDANFDKDFNINNSTVFLQRVCINFDGKITDKLTYRIGGDFIRETVLTDAYLKYAVCDAFVIQAGQMKTPFTIENQFNPAFDCELFDYATVIKQLAGYEGGITGIGALGRDIGVMVSGSLFKGWVDYKIGIFNGNGINKKDNNLDKDIIARLDIHPWIKELTITGSYQNGHYTCDSTMRGDNNRWSAGIQYKTDRIVVRSEYIGGKTGRMDSSFNSNGFYATAGYWFKLGKEGTQKLMPVIRYERLEKDEAINKGAVAYYTAGVYYLPVKQVNLKFNYQLIQPETGDKSHAIVAMLNFKF